MTSSVTADRLYCVSKSRPIIHKYLQTLNCRTRIAITRLNPLLRPPEFKLRLTEEKIGLSVIAATKKHCRVSLKITGTFGCAESRIKKSAGRKSDMHLVCKEDFGNAL